MQWQSHLELLDIDVLLHPTTLMYIDFQQLLSLPVLAKSYAEKIKKNSAALCYWHAINNSFAQEFGLYVPDRWLNRGSQYFFEHIWPTRRKWIPHLSQDSEVFKIKVIAR